MQLCAGIVSEVIANKGAVRVTLPDADNTDTYELPVLMRCSRGSRHYHLPAVGDQVYVALDDNGEDGCVLGAIYSEADPPPFSSADKCGMVFADSTSVKYDQNAHLMDIEFPDGTTVAYDAQSHRLDLTVGSNGTVTVTCPGAVAFNSAQSIALTAPRIALNTAALTCLDPTPGSTGYCAASFKGNVNVDSQSFKVTSQAVTLKAPVSVQGDMTSTGSITASGSIIDGGTNTNHHSHPEYKLK